MVTRWPAFIRLIRIYKFWLREFSALGIYVQIGRTVGPCGSEIGIHITFWPKIFDIHLHARRLWHSPTRSTFSAMDIQLPREVVVKLLSEQIFNTFTITHADNAFKHWVATSYMTQQCFHTMSCNSWPHPTRVERILPLTFTTSFKFDFDNITLPNPRGTYVDIDFYVFSQIRFWKSNLIFIVMFYINQSSVEKYQIYIRFWKSISKFKIYIYIWSWWWLMS